MIYEDIEVQSLQPVKIEQGIISYAKRSERKRKRAKAGKTLKPETADTGVIDMLIKQCVFCLAVLAILTIINIVGTAQVFSSVLKVIESHSIGDYFVGSRYV